MIWSRTPKTIMQISIKSRIKYRLVLFFKGALMGAADIFPGVSGGTIAFISGIYEELIESINSINIDSLRLLGKQEFSQFWKKINGNFILTLACGALFSISFLSHLIYYLLAEETILVWSFFFGLILASASYILRQLESFNFKELVGLTVGIVIVVLISIAPRINSSDDLLVLFFGGSIAICAMILPGISGSFILLLLGIYPIVISAISQMQWDVLFVFGSGCMFGLLVFSRALTILLKTYYSLSISVLTGFLLGSLVIVWPWKNVVKSISTDMDSKLFFPSQLLMPGGYLSKTGQDPQTYLAFSLIMFGFFTIVALEFFSEKTKKQGD